MSESNLIGIGLVIVPCNQHVGTGYIISMAIYNHGIFVPIRGIRHWNFVSISGDDSVLCGISYCVSIARRNDVFVTSILVPGTKQGTSSRCTFRAAYAVYKPQFFLVGSR